MPEAITYNLSNNLSENIFRVSGSASLLLSALFVTVIFSVLTTVLYVSLAVLELGSISILLGLLLLSLLISGILIINLIIR